MSDSAAVDATAICPQCRTLMVHVAVTPHPVVRNMQRNTYLCSPCNRTRTYMLPVKALENVAGLAQPQLQPTRA
jgi:hypothetical protein